MTQQVNRHHFKWLLHLAVMCSTLLLILVYISMGDVVNKTQASSDESEIVLKAPPAKQTRKTALARRLEEIEDELFKIHRTILPLHRQNDLALNLTKSLPTKDIHGGNEIKPKSNEGPQPTPIQLDNFEKNAEPAEADNKLKKSVQEAKIDPLTVHKPGKDVPPTMENKDMLTKGHHLLILSYMRSGSSMNGNVFKDTGDDFYVYEPLIKFAPYHYFTENSFCMMRSPNCSKYDLEGHHVEDKIETSIRTLRNLYSCNLRGLDDRILRSIMFENKSGKTWTDFAKCYVEVAENKTVENLNKYLENAVGKDEFDKHENVFRYLNTPGPKVDKFQACLDNLEAQCRASIIRVAKVLRISARLIPRLLNEFPNLKILFVLRDPRGIMNSRIETYWFPVSVDKPKEVTDNIKSLCNKMESDVQMVPDLKRDFPDRIIDYRLEDIVKKPLDAFNDIFDLMNTTMTDRHKNKIKDIFKAKPNFQTKWVVKLKKDFIKLTEESCSNVFRYYRYFRMTIERGFEN